MLSQNLFRDHKLDDYQQVEPHEITTWSGLLVQLVRIVANHNDWDPKRVPENRQ